MLMAVGGEQTSLGSAALMTLQRRMEQVVEKEVTRISAKRQRYREQGKPAPTQVKAGIDEHFRQVEHIEQRVQMLLGIFASQSVLLLDSKSAYSVRDVLL
jgi:uracil-DNA glycosylase